MSDLNFSSTDEHLQTARRLVGTIGDRHYPLRGFRPEAIIVDDPLTLTHQQIVGEELLPEAPKAELSPADREFMEQQEFFISQLSGEVDKIEAVKASLEKALVAEYPKKSLGWWFNRVEDEELRTKLFRTCIEQDYIDDLANLFAERLKGAISSAFDYAGTKDRASYWYDIESKAKRGEIKLKSIVATPPLDLINATYPSLSNGWWLQRIVDEDLKNKIFINVKEQGRQDNLKSLNQRGNGIVDNLLSWSCTEEGDDYWSDINRKLNNKEIALTPLPENTPALLDAKPVRCGFAEGTIGWHYWSIEDETLRVKAIRNCIKQHGVEKLDKKPYEDRLSSAINTGMSWNSTEEGRTFWSKIFDDVNAGKIPIRVLVYRKAYHESQIRKFTQSPHLPACGPLTREKMAKFKKFCTSLTYTQPDFGFESTWRLKNKKKQQQYDDNDDNGFYTQLSEDSKFTAKMDSKMKCFNSGRVGSDPHNSEIRTIKVASADTERFFEDYKLLRKMTKKKGFIESSLSHNSNYDGGGHIHLDVRKNFFELSCNSDEMRNFKNLFMARFVQNMLTFFISNPWLTWAFNCPHDNEGARNPIFCNTIIADITRLKETYTASMADIDSKEWAVVYRDDRETIEFRLLRMPRSPKELKFNFQFVNAVYKYIFDITKRGTLLQNKKITRENLNKVTYEESVQGIQEVCETLNISFEKFESLGKLDDLRERYQIEQWCIENNNGTVLN